MILITGGAGYIGSHVNKELSAEGYETIVLDNLIYGHEQHVKWGKFVFGDLSDKEQLRLLFNKFDIQAVIHLAAYCYIGESINDPQKYFINNVITTINLLELMLEFNIKHFIFASSCSTYGNPIESPISEEHPQNPISPYGQSKLMIEKILESYSKAYNLNFISLRFFNAAGADPENEIGEKHIPETHLIPLILDTALGLRDEIIVYGDDYNTFDGTCIRDYIHVTDLAKAHLLALKYLFNNGKSHFINLGSSYGFSVKQIIDKVKEVTNNKVNVIIEQRRPGDPSIVIGNAEKAKKILNWIPKYNDLGLIINTAWEWHKNINNL